VAADGDEETTTTKASTETDTDTPRFNLEKIVQTVKDFKSSIGF
jgi:hypothetical protein